MPKYDLVEYYFTKGDKAKVRSFDATSLDAIRKNVYGRYNTYKKSKTYNPMDVSNDNTIRYGFKVFVHDKDNVYPFMNKKPKCVFEFSYKKVGEKMVKRDLYYVTKNGKYRIDGKTGKLIRG